MSEPSGGGVKVWKAEVWAVAMSTAMNSPINNCDNFMGEAGGFAIKPIRLG
jgi:hypothetical protein